MNWITPNGVVALTTNEVARLAVAAARYDVLNGHAFNLSPVIEPVEVFK